MQFTIKNTRPAAHLREELSKLPREAISSAVSSRVRLSFREFFASRDREKNICYAILPRKAEISQKTRDVSQGNLLSSFSSVRQPLHSWGKTKLETQFESKRSILSHYITSRSR